MCRRFSIQGLMCAVPVVALGLVAIRSAPPAAHWLVGAAACLFGLIGLLAASARHRSRPALAAFAGVGSFYLLLCFGPGIELEYVDYLPPSAALDRLFPVLYSSDYVYKLALEEYCDCSDCITRVHSRLRDGFLGAGHIGFALLSAALCGLAAWGLSSPRRVNFRQAAEARPDKAN